MMNIEQYINKLNTILKLKNKPILKLIINNEWGFSYPFINGNVLYFVKQYNVVSTIEYIYYKDFDNLYNLYILNLYFKNAIEYLNNNFKLLIDDNNYLIKNINYNKSLNVIYNISILQD